MRERPREQSLVSLVMEMLQTLHADGLGQKDHSAIAKYNEKIAGTAIKSPYILNSGGYRV